MSARPYLLRVTDNGISFEAVGNGYGSAEAARAAVQEIHDGARAAGQLHNVRTYVITGPGHLTIVPPPFEPEKEAQVRAWIEALR